MVVSLLFSALLGASALSLIVYLMGGTLWQVLAVYVTANTVIALGLGVLRAYLAAAKGKKD